MTTLARPCSATTCGGRLGTGRDTADLVSFLLSEQGGWINKQVLYSDGGRWG